MRPQIAAQIGGALLVPAIVYGISAWHGFRSVQECRADIVSQQACRDGDLDGCLKLQPDKPEPSHESSSTLPAD